MMSNVFLMMTRSLASGARILEVIDEKIDLTDENAKDISVERGEIEFDHVWFKYKEEAKEYVLSDVSFHIKAGQTVGIIGQTGAAKTTLVQLIPRLYDTVRGTVKVDGVDVRNYPMQHLRDAIAMVLQKNTLFSGTMLDNLNGAMKTLRWRKLKKPAGLPVSMNLLTACRTAIRPKWDRAVSMCLAVRNSASALQEPF